MTTQELEAVKKEISEVSAFVKERVQPLREERDRLEKTITDLTATERDIRRRALLSDGSGQRRRVESGLYAGSDVLDLAIARSLYASARITGKSAGLDEWERHLKAAMGLGGRRHRRRAGRNGRGQPALAGCQP